MMDTDVMWIVSGPTNYVWNTVLMSQVTKYICGLKVLAYVCHKLNRHA
jgi:hypothetical protein